MRKIILILLSCTVVASLTGCSLIKSLSKPTEPIESVTLTTSPTWGEAGTLITTKIQVFSDGRLIIEEYTDLNVSVSYEQLQISEDDFALLEKSINKNDFFSLPEYIETGVLDGSFTRITVDTETKTHSCYGLILEDYDKKFGNIHDVIMEIAERAY